MLPSGQAFRLRVPDVESLVSRGLMPDDLRQMALKFGASTLDPESLDTEALTQMLRFMRTMVAFSLQSIWDGEKPPESIAELHAEDAPWQPITVSVGMLEEGSIDGDDYAALQGIVQRRFTAEAITAMSLRERGFLTVAEAEQIAEGGETTRQWSNFRDGPERGDPGEDSGAVRDAPVDDARDSGSGRRARGRRRSASSSSRG